MKNEIVQEAHFYPEDVKAMYDYIEAIKTLNLKPEVELGLSRSIHNTYVFHVTALKPAEVDTIYVNTLKLGSIAGAAVSSSIASSYTPGSKIKL